MSFGKQTIRSGYKPTITRPQSQTSYHYGYLTTIFSPKKAGGIQIILTPIAPFIYLFFKL